MSNKIIIINGPNLNLLGEREQSQYGKEDYKYLEEICSKRSFELKINENISVKDLLKKYKLKEKQIAIELNGTILPKQNYKKKIKNRDKIEIVHFIGGG